MPDEAPAPAPEAPLTALQVLKPSTSTVASVFGGGALATIILWVLGEYAHISPPPEVAAAFTAILAGLFGLPFSGGTSEKAL